MRVIRRRTSGRMLRPCISLSQSGGPPLWRYSHVCIPWRVLGTHRHDLGAMLPATERFVTVHGVHYIELSDGAGCAARAASSTSMTLATQLGLLPARGAMLGETALLLLRGFGLRSARGLRPSPTSPGARPHASKFAPRP